MGSSEDTLKVKTVEKAYVQYFNHQYNDYILGNGEGGVIYGQKHFYIQYKGGQEKSIFEKWKNARRWSL